MRRMNNQMTRRQLAGAMLAGAAAAQAPPSAPNLAAELDAARHENQRSAETLATATVAMDAEPAFHFTA